MAEAAAVVVVLTMWAVSAFPKRNLSAREAVGGGGIPTLRLFIPFPRVGAVYFLGRKSATLKPDTNIASKQHRNVPGFDPLVFHGTPTVQAAWLK